MNMKTQDAFLMELEEARQKLAGSDRNFEQSDAVGDHTGLDFDLELPYSSLPKISTDRWKR